MFGLIKRIFCALSLLTFSKPVETMPILYDAAILPVVVLHGVESSSEKMIPFCDWLSDSFNVQVFNVEIGNGEKTSLYTPLSKQLAELCATIYKIDELQEGFNFIGMSQGGLLARGYVEQCNLYPVHNLITLVTPHGGEFIQAITTNFYTDFFQQHVSVAGYWRNPHDLTNYFSKCSFLPILNNEIETADSAEQLEQIIKLHNFIMIWSPYDTVLKPSESGKFSFYDEQLKVVSLVETDLYKKDLLGLKYLNENGKLKTYETNCSHVNHRNPECFAQLYPILKKYL
jgi:palmitoyl-protein thioesterase